jgi:hypothetical protein
MPAPELGLPLLLLGLRLLALEFDRAARLYVRLEKFVRRVLGRLNRLFRSQRRVAVAVVIGPLWPRRRGAGILRVVSQEPGANNPMDTDENKERTTPGKREEVRLTGRGGEPTKGRASRPDLGSTRGTSGAVAAATGATRPLLRLTPAGDAARMWLATAIAVLVVTFVFLVVGRPLRSVHWLLGTNVLYGLILVLTWGAM